MVTPNTFYKSYQLHHHRAKAGILKTMLDNELLKAEDLVDARWAFKDEDLARTLRIEMRTNLFHAFETFFTMYFCLQPDEHGTVDDLNLYYNLSQRSFYYESIRNIAEGKDDLSVLEKDVQFGNKKVLFGQYLFYYAFKEDKFPPGLHDSLEAIKYAMKNLAQKMSDTTEYNSYKHALRSVPAFLEFAFAKKDTMKILQRFDMKYSMTYFQEFKDGSFHYITKALDTERDLRMTLLASNLIYNIIMFRRASLVRDLAEIPLIYFSKDSIDECLKRNVSAVEFKNSFKPVKG